MFKALLVDDEPLERRAIKYILSMERPLVKVVGEAGSGCVGLRLAKELQPDIVFMDVKMPGLGGLDALHMMNSVSPKTKTIVLTAYEEFNFAQTALKLGAKDYLLKPVRNHDIVRVVDDICQEINADMDREVEQIRLRRELKELRPLIATSLAIDLCAGYFRDLSKVRKQVDILGLGPGPYRVLLVNIQGASGTNCEGDELKRRLLRRQIYESLLQLMDDTKQAVIAPFGRDTFVVLATLPEEGQALELANSLCLVLSEIQNFTAIVGVGECCQELGDVHLSYKTAYRALFHGNFFGSNQVILASQLEQQNRHAAVPYPFDLEARLVESVELGEKQEAYKCLDQIWLQILTDPKGNAKLVRWRALELVMLIVRSAIQGGAKVCNMVELQQECLEELVSVTDAMGPKKAVFSLLDKCLTAVRSNQLSSQTESIEKAKDFIMAHFKEQLTLERVAGHVHLSPYYFSRLFKQSEGINFIDYLTNIRLETAKELLAKTNYKVACIAEEVGYSEPSYFSRIFRKSYGYTPANFRKRVQQ